MRPFISKSNCSRFNDVVPVSLKSLLPLVICLLVVGCGSPVPAGLATVAEGEVSATPEPLPSQELLPASATVFAGERTSDLLARSLAEHDSVEFDSHSASQQPGESAMTLTLLRDGRARVVYRATESEVSSGTYSVDDQDRLKLDFGPYDPWPRMRLTVDHGIIVILAPEKEEVIRIAYEAGVSREEISDEDVAAAFQAWPLQQTASSH
jgi:hypothetical protein